jgi:hypothetical protein
MISIDNSLCSPYLSLFFTIHNMIWMNSIISTLVRNLIEIIYALTILVYHYLIVPGRIRVILICSRICSCFRRILTSSRWTWTWNFITLNVLLLLLMILLLILLCIWALIFVCTSLFSFIVFSLLILIVLILVFMLIECHTIII